MIPVEFKLAWRYFRSKRRHPFIGIISNISIAGVALGVAALIIVLAVMSGFEKDLVERVVGTYAHTVIESDGGFTPDPALIVKVKSLTPDIQAVAPYVQLQALLRNKNRARGVIVKGARGEEEKTVSLLGEYLKEGRYPEEGTQEVLLGDVLARLLGVKAGEELMFMAPAERKEIRLTVSGLYHSGMYDYDANLIYLPLNLAQRLTGLDERVSGLSVCYRDARQAVIHQRALQRAIGFPFYVRSWQDMNRTLFEALKLEKTVMFVILALIVAVACFNIIGTLTLLVMDKTKDIGILMALGAGGVKITHLFTLVGCWIGGLGTLIGLGAGLGISDFIRRYPIIKIPSDVYYFDRLPVDLRVEDALCIGLCALVLTFLSTLYPAWAASRLKAVEALRYE